MLGRTSAGSNAKWALQRPESIESKTAKQPAAQDVHLRMQAQMEAMLSN
jgi:hypothetical protein